MALSARNTIRGKVTDVKLGIVTAQVKVDIGAGNQITSVITTDAIKDLGIDVGSEVSVIVKATEVMLST